MNFFLISDNIDTRAGMRLAGIDGAVVHESGEALDALNRAVADENVAIVLMTGKAIELCRERVYEIKMGAARPLIVEIPDRHGTAKITETIKRYVSEAIGIKL
ncbi:MAG: V-type ATP synthase subunit F [Oscillospiraceae bacterium]|jgi:V/A-type H+-transporting ATPase subunit F|nr:V-type ATP synthase subunit F [Oscillospiraceae bacterium]